MKSIGAYYTFIVSMNERRLEDQRRLEIRRAPRPSLFERIQIVTASWRSSTRNPA